jgi:hypothetical protein
VNLGSATVPVAAFGVSPDAFFRPVAFLSPACPVIALGRRRITRHLSLFVRTFAGFCGVSPRCSNKSDNASLRDLTRFNAILHLCSQLKFLSALPAAFTLSKTCSGIIAARQWLVP